MDINKLMPLISAKVDQDRAEEAYGNQLTIAELLYKLAKLDAHLPVHLDYPDAYAVPEGFSCYRGFYSDLAINYGVVAEYTREEFEELLAATVGKAYEGYKGGTFVMSPSTLVWVAQDCGDCSRRGVTDVQQLDDKIVIMTKEILP